MRLEIDDARQFRQLLTALLDEVVDARFHFNLHQDLVKASDEYFKEFSQSPTFWGLTFSAHIDVVVLRLCRVYDTDRSALNLRNLLDTIKANLNIFDQPSFRERLKGNSFVDSLAADSKPPDAGQLEKDIQAVCDSNPLVRKLVLWRHNYIAHRNSHYTLNPRKFEAEYPLCFSEVDELSKRALDIGNRYSLLFDASVHSTMLVGREDYLNILKAVREQVEQHENKMKEEWKRFGAVLKPEVF